MNFLTCTIINGPFATLNIMVDLFYIFCILSPPPGGRIKQPQKLLLGSVIFCTATYLFSGFLLLCVNVTVENMYLILASYVVYAWGLCTSVSSFVWLNFFYCTQIVPAQGALFIWIKTHIKHIIYCVWLLEKVFGLLSVGVMAIDHLSVANLLHFSHNVTLHTGSVYIQIPYSVLQSNEYQIAVHIVQISFLFYVCVMMLSNGSTVIYLGKHARRMLANGQCLSCPRFRGQARVTVTGILQGILFFLFAMWTVYSTWVRDLSESLNPCYSFIVVNLYTTGSLFTLGVVQSVLRLRFEAIWLRVSEVTSLMLVRRCFVTKSDDA